MELLLDGCLRSARQKGTLLTQLLFPDNSFVPPRQIKSHCTQLSVIGQKRLKEFHNRFKLEKEEILIMTRDHQKLGRASTVSGRVLVR
jgi:hypothetical protein